MASFVCFYHWRNYVQAHRQDPTPPAAFILWANLRTVISNVPQVCPLNDVFRIQCKSIRDKTAISSGRPICVLMTIISWSMWCSAFADPLWPVWWCSCACLFHALPHSKFMFDLHHQHVLYHLSSSFIVIVHSSQPTLFVCVCVCAYETQIKLVRGV